MMTMIAFHEYVIPIEPVVVYKASQNQLMHEADLVLRRRKFANRMHAESVYHSYLAANSFEKHKTNGKTHIYKIYLERERDLTRIIEGVDKKNPKYLKKSVQEYTYIH